MRVYPHATRVHTHMHTRGHIGTRDPVCKCIIFHAHARVCACMRAYETYTPYLANEDAKLRLRTCRYSSMWFYGQRTRRPVSVWKLQGYSPSRGTHASVCGHVYTPEQPPRCLSSPIFITLQLGHTMEFEMDLEAANEGPANQRIRMKNARRFGTVLLSRKITLFE